jgi:hypothetical protein
MSESKKITDIESSHPIDLGCGPNKISKAFGVDQHPYPGVDKIVDLDVPPWPLESDRYTTIFCHHVIEHMSDIPCFMSEVHRIGMDGAHVDIITPHFSSIDSWADPTHRWHLSCYWYETFTRQYLQSRLPKFEAITTEVGFSKKSVQSIIPRVLIAVKGLRWWEKRYAFIFRARNIHTVLRIGKS